jgi:hypothetical protein
MTKAEAEAKGQARIPPLETQEIADFPQICDGWKRVSTRA